MGKAKKNKPYRQPLLTYYKGPKVDAATHIDDNRINEIKQELGKFHDSSIKIGLNSALRSIKNGKSKAIFYDLAAPSYLTKFLLDHSRKHNIPCLGITDLQSTTVSKIKSLLLMSVEVSEDPDLNQFILNLSAEHMSTKGGHCAQEFAHPDLVKTISTGKSKCKKDKRKQEKKERKDKIHDQA